MKSFTLSNPAHGSGFPTPARCVPPPAGAGPPGRDYFRAAGGLTPALRARGAPGTWRPHLPLVADPCPAPGSPSDVSEAARPAHRGAASSSFPSGPKPSDRPRVGCVPRWTASAWRAGSWAGTELPT